MVSEGLITLVAGIAVTVVAFLVPAILARRIRHGEARFDKDGKIINDE